MDGDEVPAVGERQLVAVEAGRRSGLVDELGDGLVAHALFERSAVEDVERLAPGRRAVAWTTFVSDQETSSARKNSTPSSSKIRAWWRRAGRAGRSRARPRRHGHVAAVELVHPVAHRAATRRARVEPVAVDHGLDLRRSGAAGAT